MPALKLKQLQYESDMWKRLLGFMSDENIFLKNRISEVLKNGYDIQLLDQLENFQSRFIKEDELIGLLRHEVSELDKSLKMEVIEDEKKFEEVKHTLRKIRANMRVAEKHFGRLKLEFNSYLFVHMN